MAQQHVSVVFCTDILSDGDLRAVIGEVKKSRAEAPVIVLSRLADWDAYLRAIGAGAFDYIASPPDSAETERILRSALTEPSRLRRTAQAVA